jgi:DNA-binding transcriptional ArsR family regulator
VSYDATNWAIKQRGIKPALKVVLWHLCDRYHKDNGCYPSQETLANDCEVPRSTLNVYLKELEDAGLIAREQRRKEGTNKQERTRYRFPFEPDFPTQAAQKPSPETGHGPESRNDGEPSPENGETRVQNLDSNLVKEPVTEPVTRASAPDQDDLKILEKRHDALRLGRHGKSWPDVLNQSKDWSFRQFVALDEDDRLLAEQYRDAYLAACPKVKAGERKGEPDAVILGVYLRDKLFRDVQALSVKRQEQGSGQPQEGGQNLAVAYGPVHGAMLFRLLLEGPERPEAAPTNGLWLSSALRAAWPKLAAFWQQTDLRGGVPATEADVELGRYMEFVPAESEVFGAWRQEIRRLNLPEVRVRDGMRGLYFPVGGPAGLSEFEAMAREVRGDEHAA